MDREKWEQAKRNFGAQPLWAKAYGAANVLIGLAAPILVFSGLVLPGLILFGLFIVDSAIVLPLLVAAGEKRERTATHKKHA